MLADSGRAIGAVTELLRNRLDALLAPATATAGRPEPSTNGGSAPAGAYVNLFLFEIRFDGFLRNHPLDDGQPDPLWLSLHYLLTAFDEQHESDSSDAHELLGRAIRSLHGLNFLEPSGAAALVAALDDNPDPLKLTFVEASPDLLSKLMQGPDEKYRCSVAFEVRPVMVAADQLPRYSLLVGVDYEHATIVGDEGVHIPVLPSLGPTLDDVAPVAVDPGDELTVTGESLAAAGLSARLDSVEIPITAQQPGSLRCTVDGPIAGGTALSAGSHVLTVAQLCPDGRLRTSNPLVVGLRPVLTAAAPADLARQTPADPASPVYGSIDLTGLPPRDGRRRGLRGPLPGRADRSSYDSFTAPPPPPPPPPVAPQTRLRVTIPEAEPCEPGSYRVILRVNGQQARTSPSVDLTVP